MRYPTGQPVRVTTSIRDVAGALVNAGALSLALRKPDASTQTYGGPVNDSTGIYHQDIPAADLNQVGHYQYVWTATGTGAGVSVGALDVYDPFEVTVLSLQDAKLALNIAQATTTYDSEIADMLASVTANLERITGGPIVTRQVTEDSVEASHFGLHLCLRYRPVVSVVSVTDSLGVTTAVSDIDIDTNASTLSRSSGLAFLGFSPTFTAPQFTVVYTAGWGTALPAAFATAARIIISHLWETQRGPAASPSVGGEQTVMTGMGFAMPYRALEVLSPYTLEAFV